MNDDPKIIGIEALCQLLKLDVEQIKALRRGRDATFMPPPLLGAAGLSWYEADIAAWLAWADERREWIEAGLDPAELTPPVYLAAEPQAQVTKK